LAVAPLLEIFEAVTVKGKLSLSNTLGLPIFLGEEGF
jgi:hypothetical protein